MPLADPSPHHDLLERLSPGAIIALRHAAHGHPCWTAALIASGEWHAGIGADGALVVDASPVETDPDVSISPVWTLRERLGRNPSAASPHGDIVVPVESGRVFLAAEELARAKGLSVAGHCVDTSLGIRAWLIVDGHDDEGLPTGRERFAFTEWQDGADSERPTDLGVALRVLRNVDRWEARQVEDQEAPR